MKIISREEAKELGLKRYFTGDTCKHGHVREFLYPACNRSEGSRCLVKYAQVNGKLL